MKVTYLGDKVGMCSYGYDFSKGSCEIPESDSHAINKFKGNRYFHCDSTGNYEAPKFYVHLLRNIRLSNDASGNARFKKIQGTRKQKGFATEKEAKIWIKTEGGTLGKTHIIKLSDESISDSASLYSGNDALSFGIFRLKTDGEPRNKPDKMFSTKEEAEKYILEKEYNPEERVILEKE